MAPSRKADKTSKQTKSRSGKSAARKTSSSRSAQGARSGRAVERAARSRGTGAKRASNARSGTPDALELLTADHRAVQKMFRKAERMEPGDAELQDLVEKACAALTLHAEIEEQVFYPPLRERDEDAIAEAQVEHDVAKDLIAQLQSMRGGDERYKATFKVLGEYVNHHIEEEEGQIFRLAKRAKLDLAAIGEEIAARKDRASGARAAASPAPRRRAGERSRPDGDTAATSRTAGREEEADVDLSTRGAIGTGRTSGDVGEDTEQPGRSGRYTGAPRDE